VQDWAERLGDEFFQGDHDCVLRAIGKDPALAAMVAHRVGDGLTADARAHWNVFPREKTWLVHQRALVALSGVEGVDHAALAAAVVEAVATQRLDGRGSPLDPDVFDWMLRWATDDVLAAASDDRGGTGFRFLQMALLTHPDPRAVVWMVEWFRAAPTFARFMYSDMMGGWHRTAWSTADWNHRVHLLCDARLPAAPILVTPTLSPVTSAAQVRLACSYASLPTDHLVRGVARNVSSYRKGNADDTALIWWDAGKEEQETLRWLLELCGPAGTRQALVEAARRRRRIDEATADFLGGDLSRPDWADCDVAWEVDEMVDAGWVVIPDGLLGAGDPYWAFEGLRCVIEVPPGRYPARLHNAIHPLFGRECAFAELLIESDREAEIWERAGAGSDGTFGYRVEVGVGSFGSVTALESGSVHELASRDLLGFHAKHLEVDAGETGSFVMFTVGPQHQLCRTWAGRAADGRVVRVLTDLGLVGLDPQIDSKHPLRAYGPSPAHDPPPPPLEPPSDHPEIKSGIRASSRWVAREGAAVEPGTVTVLEVRSPEHSWLNAYSVWYRRADNSGQLATTHEFKRRFTKLAEQ